MSIKIKSIIKESLGLSYYYLYRRFIKKFGSKCLIYHAFGSKLKHDTYGISISMRNFKTHIDFLRDNYEFVHINNKLDNKFYISLTIDDGYSCTNDALDLLNNYNIPVTLFVTSENLDKNQYLSSDDLLSISKLSNVQIGSHGLSHKKLSQLSYDNQYIELSESKNILNQIINKDINGVSFPHGSFNIQTIEILNKIGYKFAATSIKGINSSTTNNYLLHRDEVISTDSINDLNKKIKGYYEYY